MLSYVKTKPNQNQNQNQTNKQTNKNNLWDRPWALLLNITTTETGYSKAESKKGINNS